MASSQFNSVIFTYNNFFFFGGGGGGGDGKKNSYPEIEFIQVINLVNLKRENLGK